MSLDNQISIQPWRKPWITTAALVAIGAAWAWIGAWGWLHSVDATIAPILVVLTGGAQIIAARMMAISGNASPGRRAALIALAVACAAWSGFSGKRGVELAQTAPAAAYNAAAAHLAAIEAAIATLPPAPTVDTAGRSLGPQRQAILIEARSVNMARLVADRDAAKAAMPAKPVIMPISPAMLWAVAALVEALGLFGLWAIARPGDQRQPAKVIAMTAGQALARQRWGEPRQA